MLVEPHNFTDKEGIEVEYNTCYFRIEDDNGMPFAVILNTKAISTKQERKIGLLEVEIDNTGKNKPRLTSFDTKSDED